jgi:hypothetical protein
MHSQLPQFEIGDQVQIERGELAGLEGKVTRLEDGDINCVLTIDGWPKGALLAVNSSLLCRMAS